MIKSGQTPIHAIEINDLVFSVGIGSQFTAVLLPMIDAYDVRDEQVMRTQFDHLVDTAGQSVKELGDHRSMQKRRAGQRSQIQSDELVAVSSGIRAAILDSIEILHTRQVHSEFSVPRDQGMTQAGFPN